LYFAYHPRRFLCQDVFYTGSKKEKSKSVKRQGGVHICSEHISLRNATEKWSTASEKEWQQLTEETFSKEEEQREEPV